MLIRPPTEAELALVRHSWRRSLRLSRSQTQPHRDPDASDRVVPWGRGAVLRRVAMRWLARWIETTATTETVLVAAQELEGGDSEVLAWCCREVERDRFTGLDQCQLHFVYTIQAARGRGLASALVRAVHAEADARGVAIEPTYLTHSGTRLLAKVATAMEEAK